MGYKKNEFIILDDQCWIVLHNQKGERAGMALVDTKDYNKVINYQWSQDSNGAIRQSDGWLLSHIILDFYFKDHSKQVDHENKMRWDNRKRNLRICTQPQNLFNRGKNKNNTSGYKGITEDRRKRGKRWHARIGVENKIKSLGYYITKEEAARAYNEAALKYHGEFALLNRIGE